MTSPPTRNKVQGVGEGVRDRAFSILVSSNAILKIGSRTLICDFFVTRDNPSARIKKDIVE